MPPIRWRLPANLLTAFGLAMAAGLMALNALIVLQLRDDAWTSAADSARNLSLAMRQKLTETVETLDLLLQGVAESRQVPAVSELGPPLRHLMLFDRVVSAPHLGAILVLNAAGDIVLDSDSVEPRRANFADREYFRAHQAKPDLGLYVAAPVHGRLHHRWLLPVSRRLTAPDGSFAGIVVGLLELDALRALFEGLSLGPHGNIGLTRDDGAVLLRVPYRTGDFGTDIGKSEVFRRGLASGGAPFVARSPMDGTTRYYVSERVARTPMMLNLGVAVADIEAAWRPRGLLIGLATLLLSGGLVVATLLLRRELGRRHRAEAEAQDSAARYRLLADHSCDMVSRVDAKGVRVYASPAAKRILGREPAAMLGVRPRDEVHPDDRDAFVAGTSAVWGGEREELTLTYRLRHADGHWVWIEATIRLVRDAETGAPDGTVAVSRDVTERVRLEAELARLAAQDGLTGIANRRSFDEAVRREWAEARRSGALVSVLLLDVDHFKAFNDHYGHQAGDECLRRIALVARETVRRLTDVVARYGGEEFAILLPQTDAAGAEAVAERMRAEIEAMAVPHRGGAPGGVVTASIGAATARPAEGGREPAQMLSAADRALYAAKRAGRNQVAAASLVAVGAAGTAAAPSLPARRGRLAVAGAVPPASGQGERSGCSFLRASSPDQMGPPDRDLP
jgi:diguanylate cyclase (GGDEF)-like protein/PAS domain S-box-containing protein